MLNADMATCRGCDNTFNTEELLTKQVRWRRSGTNGTVLKSKNIGRFCIDCVEEDEQYNILTRPEVRKYLLEKINV